MPPVLLAEWYASLRVAYAAPDHIIGACGAQTVISTPNEGDEDDIEVLTAGRELHHGPLTRVAYFDILTFDMGTHLI